MTTRNYDGIHSSPWSNDILDIVSVDYKRVHSPHKIILIIQ